MSEPGQKDRDLSKWLSDTFPTTFTVSDFIQECENARKTDEVIYAKMLNNRFSPLNVESIKNVYEKVWLINRLQQKENEDVFPLRSEQPVPKIFKNVETQTEKPTDCLWTSDELDILRSEFSAVRNENSRLQVAAKHCEEDAKLATSKFDDCKTLLAEAEAELSEAKKANTRLYILCKFLKTQAEDNEREIEQRGVALKEAMHEKQTAIAVSLNLHKEHERLRVECENLKLDMSQQRTKCEQQIRQESEHIRGAYIEEIESLSRKVADLSAQLAREREDHRRSKKGLEHLRKHFAGLPASAATASAGGSPSKTYLSKWTT